MFSDSAKSSTSLACAFTERQRTSSGSRSLKACISPNGGLVVGVTADYLWQSLEETHELHAIPNFGHRRLFLDLLLDLVRDILEELLIK